MLGKEHPDTATTYNNIAATYDSLGDYPNALEYYKKAMTVRNLMIGPNLTKRIIELINNNKEVSSAIKYYKGILKDSEANLGFNHTDTKTIRMNCCRFLLEWK